MFDVKTDFTIKEIWVKEGHRIPDPKTSSYSGVVRRKSIRILLMYAALHEVDVMDADIINSYLQAPTSVKHFIICYADLHGIEHTGKWAMVVRDFYGGKLEFRDL